MAKVGRLVKESSVTEISRRLSEQPNFFVATMSRVSAPDADGFRQKLAGSRSRLVMVKRRLGARAIEPLKLPALSEWLTGSVGFVLAGDDVLQTAKLLVEFHKAHEEHMTLRGALIDGQLLDATRIKQLASLPPKPVLLAEVLWTIESPLADVIFTIERLIGDVAWFAEQVAAKKSTQSGGVPNSTA